MRKGLLLNLISNITFFLSGYALHFFLGNSMPPAEYGIVGTILTILDFEYMFVSNGARQSLASQISGGRYNVLNVVKKTFIFQLIVISLFFSINFFGAPLLSAVLNDPSLEFYFRVAGLLVVVNGLQVILLGINDGLQRFGTSALLSTLYPLAKLGTIPLILFFFFRDPVLGVEVGFTLAVAVTIIVGCILLARNATPVFSQSGTPIPFLYVVRHTLTFSLFFIVVSLVLSFDTLIVKALVEPASMAGYYTGAVNFGKVAYYLLQAFSTVILPVVAGLMGEGKLELARKRVQDLILVAFTFILPICAIISASSGVLLSSFYSEGYIVAAPALTLLTFSNFCMGMTVVVNMVLNAVRPSRFSDLLSLISLLVVIPAFMVAAYSGGITAVAGTSVVSTALMMFVSFGRARAVIGGLMTRAAWIVVIFNLVLWGAVHILFSTLLQGAGFLTTVVVYASIYLTYLLILGLTRQVDFRALVSSLR